MLYLNNPLLTSERIIFYFETNLAALNQAVPEEVSNRPSQLSQLKSKLKANFFENLDKTASDQDVLDALANDERFKSNYPKLKCQVKSELLQISLYLNKPNDGVILAFYFLSFYIFIKTIVVGS